MNTTGARLFLSRRLRGDVNRRLAGRNDQAPSAKVSRSSKKMSLTDQSVRTMVAEIVREKILLHDQERDSVCDGGGGGEVGR